MTAEIQPDRCMSDPAPAPHLEATPARHTTIGALEIRRALPLRDRRLVGPWCFLDRYGPVTFRDDLPMDLAPHPHIGLQTVSWLLDGEVLHRDSLGSEALLRAGGLNLMTAGVGITHSEDTPMRNSGRLSGVQLWIALPDATRHIAPSFEHHAESPIVNLGDGSLTVFLGEAAGVVSPATTFSPMTGAELHLARGGSVTVPLRPDFEYSLFVLEGEAQLEHERLLPDVLYYLGMSRHEMQISTAAGARILLLGGAPFGEEILMWWNFVARTHEELVAATEDWSHGRRFGRVPGNPKPPIPAPPLRGRAHPLAAS
jgi:quercetin 2,3-dioxygenase